MILKPREKESEGESSQSSGRCVSAWPMGLGLCHSMVGPQHTHTQIPHSVFLKMDLRTGFRHSTRAALDMRARP